jgi:hypothetical protein
MHHPGPFFPRQIMRTQQPLAYVRGLFMASGKSKEEGRKGILTRRYRPGGSQVGGELPLLHALAHSPPSVKNGLIAS